MAFLEANCSDGQQSDTLNGTTTVNECSDSESKTDSSTMLRYSAISEHSTVKGTPSDIEEWLMLSVQDSHANLIQFVENDWGGADERNMWPETITTIRTVQPRIAWLENVTGLLTSGYFGTVIGDLSTSGYMGRYVSLGGGVVGSLCEGERLWIIAVKANGSKLQSLDFSKSFRAYPEESFRRKYSRAMCAMLSQDDYSRIKRDRDAVARGMERLKAIGNGQDPFLVRAAWQILSEGLIW